MALWQERCALCEEKIVQVQFPALGICWKPWSLGLLDWLYCNFKNAWVHEWHALDSILSATTDQDVCQVASLVRNMGIQHCQLSASQPRAGEQKCDKRKEREKLSHYTFCLIWLSQIYSLYTFYLLTEISLCKHVIIAIQDTTWIAFCWPHELQQTFLSKASDLMLDLMEEAKLEEIMLEDRTRMADAKLDIVLSVHTMTLDVLGSL